MKTLSLILLLFVAISTAQEPASAPAPAINWEAEADKFYKIAEQNFRAYTYWEAEAARLKAENEQLRSMLAATRGLLAQATATTPTAPVTSPPLLDTSRPKTRTTTMHGSGGTYTTSDGATIIETVPGHFEIHHKNGTVERVIQTP
jgi:hypothetical protein